MSSSSARADVFDLSRVRNRIIDHVELLPSEILDHPGQAWDHPASQASALSGILHEVGIVDEILVYKSERAGGQYVTPDGHLRKSLDPQKRWPCTVLDLTDAEADYVLATKDPVAMMKVTNAEALDALLASVSSADQAVQEMLADVAAKAGLYLEPSSSASSDVPFADFDDQSSAVFDDYVAFKFGAHSGRVSRAVYDTFEAQYNALRAEDDAVMLDDVLRVWLDV